MSTNPMTVNNLMSTEVVTIGRNETLKSAEALMESHHVRHVPVIDSDGKLCGILSARDLFRGALLRALGYGSRAEEMMLDTTVVKRGHGQIASRRGAGHPSAQSSSGAA